MRIRIILKDLHLDGIGYVCGTAVISKDNVEVSSIKFRAAVFDPPFGIMMSQLNDWSETCRRACLDVLIVASKKFWVEEKIRKEAAAVAELEAMITNLLDGVYEKEYAAMPLFALEAFWDLKDRLHNYCPLSQQEVETAVETAKKELNYDLQYQEALQRFCVLAEEEACFLSEKE